MSFQFAARGLFAFFGGAVFEGVYFVSDVGGFFEFEVVGSGEHFFLEGVEGFVDVVEFFGGGDHFAGQFAGFEFSVDAVADGFDDGLRGDVVIFIEGFLDGAAAVGFVDGAFHAGSDGVGVEVDLGFDVSGAAADHLDERGFGAEEALLVGVEDGDDGDFGEVETFAEEVDADEDVEGSLTEFAEDFGAVEGLDFGVEVFAFEAGLAHVVREIFGEAFGEGGDEGAFAFLGAEAGFGDEVGDLAGGGADGDLRIYEAGGTDDLFDDFAAGDA